MASNITTANTFETGNMKPDSGEIIDSTWGQKIAENTGYLYYDSHPLLCNWAANITFKGADYDPFDDDGTFFVKKTPGYNTIEGTFWGTQNGAVTFDVEIDGTSVISSGATSVKTGFSWDASNVTDLANFEVTYTTNSIQDDDYIRHSCTMWGTRL